MNREIRRQDRAVTDRDQIIQIVAQAKILHLGLNDHGFPYIVPLHYGYVYDKNKDVFVFYMHGAKIGHKIDLIQKNANACIELETNIALIPSEDVPCRFGSFYSSFLGQGHASIVEDLDTKKHALNLLMKNQTGRDFTFTDAITETVAVIQAEIREYTAKARGKLVR